MSAGEGGAAPSGDAAADAGGEDSGGGEALRIAREVYDSAAGLDRKHPEENARASRAFARVLSGQVEFGFVGPAFGESASADELGGIPGSGRGVDEFRAAWEGWVQPFDSYRVWPLEYSSRGDRVLVTFRVEVTLAGSGTSLETEQAVLLRTSAGKIVSMELYYRADDARTAWERE